MFLCEEIYTETATYSIAGTIKGIAVFRWLQDFEASDIRHKKTFSIHLLDEEEDR